jgi:hypothetical protein
MHDSESVWVATPSLYETLIHNTLPALTGALNLELGTAPALNGVNYFNGRVTCFGAVAR